VDPWRRLAEHNTKPFTTYTSKHRPWQLEAVFLIGNFEKEAIKIERFLKKQKSLTLLKKLIDPSYSLSGVLAQLVRVPHVRD
jgi:putative endonuclease